MAKHSPSILELARRGAEARLKELHAEIESIRRHFPGEFGLRGGVKTGGAAKRRQRRKMTAAQKKAVSARMKKYWAARRKAKNG